MMIGKVIRDTGLAQADIVPDLKEWIPEALEQMQVQLPAGPATADLTTRFHSAQLPPGMLVLHAVSWCGMRLRYRDTDNDVRTRREVKRASAGETNIFQAQPGTGYITVNDNFVSYPHLRMVKDQPWCETEYYQIKNGHIWTSFDKGTVTVHFETLPLDSDGMPLIPDNAALREALYYYARAKLVGSGRFVDRVFDERELMQRYESFAARAIEQITYPTVDEMDAMGMTINRLIKSDEYWHQFCNPGLPEKFYGTFD